MAENKKGFLLYTDQIGAIRKLVLNDKKNGTNNAGELFLHIMEYVNDENPETENFIVDVAFEPIKARLKNDLKKYETYIEKQSENGKKGGRPKKEEETQKTQPFISEPKKADTVTVTDTVISKDINMPKHEIFKNECLKSEIWLDTIAMNIKIPLDKIQFALAEFNNHLIMDGEIKQDLKDYKNHFTRWARKLKQLKAG